MTAVISVGKEDLQTVIIIVMEIMAEAVVVSITDVRIITVVPEIIIRMPSIISRNS